MRTSDEQELEKIREIADITRSALPSYETRGVFRIIEETPAGRKRHYEERVIGEVPLDYLYAGVLLVCPRGDRTDGRMKLEVSVRDFTIKIDKSASSADAVKLQENYANKGYKFEIFI